MSVINQMLRDLDAREASTRERADLPTRLRHLPPSRAAHRQSWRMLGIGLGLGMLVAGVGVSLLYPQESVPPAPAAPPAHPAPIPVPASAPVPVPADNASAITPPPAVPLPAPLAVDPAPPPLSPAIVESAPPTAAVTPKEEEIKVAAPLVEKPAPKTVEPARPPAEAAKPAKPVSPKETKSVSAASKPAATPSVPPPLPSAAGPETQIDKRSTGGQGREMAEAEYRKGMQAVKRGEGTAALPLLQRALELDPLHAKARQALLSVLVGSKQWPEAQRSAQAGLALDPAQTGWAAILARLQFEQGDAVAALDTLTRHEAHASNDADYHGLFAYLLQKQQRFVEAAQHFQTALALRPQEGRWWFGLGLALESAGRAGEARAAYTKARDVGNLPSDMAATIEQKLR